MTIDTLFELVDEGTLNISRDIIFVIDDYWVYDSENDTYKNAISNKDLYTIKKIKKYELDELYFKAMSMAAESGDLEILKYLHYNVPINCKWACSNQLYKPIRGAIYGKKLDCLKFLCENGYICEFDIVSVAAFNGSLDIIKYLHVKKPWINVKSDNKSFVQNDFWSYKDAVIFNSVSMLRYKNICCTSKSLDSASAQGHFEVFKWLYENKPWENESNYDSDRDDYDENIEDAFYRSVSLKHTDIVKYLCEKEPRLLNLL